MNDLIQFAPNVPQELALMETEGHILPGRFADQVYFQLADGKGLLLESQVAAKVNILELAPGETFCICKHVTGGARQSVSWTAWLTPESEKARAVAEREDVSYFDLEAQLQMSIDQVKAQVAQRPIPQRKPPAPERVPVQPQMIRGTGTNGPVPQPQAILATAPPSRPGKQQIPYNVAFVEITNFVTAGLRQSGEQWSDQSRQDLISTILISASKQGLLSLWERGK